MIPSHWKNNNNNNWMEVEDDSTVKKKRSLFDLERERSFGGISARKYRNEAANNLIPQISLEHVIGSKKSPSVGCLFCLKLNEGGDILASTTTDSVQIWNPQTGELLHTLKEHTEIVTSLVWFHHSNSDNPSFCTSSLDKTIKLWRNYKTVTTFKDHNDWIRCLGLSPQNETLISGCVSSVILGFNLEMEKVSFRIPNAHSSPSCPELNTINSLQFSNLNSNIFVSGARDGTIKLWDTRCLNKATNTFQAHNGKLNTTSFCRDDTKLLSGGRDSVLRLWDVRKMETMSSTIPEKGSSGLIQEYNKHFCQGYNVGCSFFNNEKHIVTGSEDKKVYIYEAVSGEVVKVLDGHPSVVHLVNCSEQDQLSILTSSIENCSILVWTPNATEEDVNTTKESVEKLEEDSFISQHRAAVESLMKKHGDQILKIFHKFNFTFSSPLDWQSLLSNVGTDTASSDLLHTINEMATDFAKALETHRQTSNLTTDMEEEEEEEEEELETEPFEREEHDDDSLEL